MTAPPLRWLFAVAAVIAGIVVLVTMPAAANHPFIATGIGLICAGIGLVVP